MAGWLFMYGNTVSQSIQYDPSHLTSTWKHSTYLLPGPVGLAAYLRVLLVCSRLLVSRFLALSLSKSSSLHVLLLSLLLSPLVVVVVVSLSIPRATLV